MRQINVFDIETELLNAANRKQNDVFYVVHTTPTIFVSNSEEYNKQFALDNNLNICHTYNMGGTIVTNSGDIDIAIYHKNGWDIGQKVLEIIRQYLTQYIDNIAICDNDLLVDNKYKIASYASINCGDDVIYSAIHISLQPDLDLINNICTKPMHKIPRGLGAYGLNINNLLQIIDNQLPNILSE